MPAQSRETWRDWMPPGAPEPGRLLTREQVAEEASRTGYDVSPEDVRYWEYQGVLPRSVRQWHNGATRAVYPAWWYPLLARSVRTLQRQGATLEEIKPRIRQLAATLQTGTWRPTIDEHTTKPSWALIEAANDYVHSVIRDNVLRTLGGEPEVGVARIELRVQLTDGGSWTTAVPVTIPGPNHIDSGE